MFSWDDKKQCFQVFVNYCIKFEKFKILIKLINTTK